LFADARAFGEGTWTYPVWSRKLQHRHVRQAQFLESGQDAKALCVITPAAIGPEYFRETFAVLKAAAGGPPDRAKMAEVMRRHGLTPAP